MINQAELLLETHLKEARIDYQREVQLVKDRRFRWDFVIGKLAIEIQGGIWHKGGHSTGKGITRDITKGRVAVMAGYIPVAFTTKDVMTGTAIAWLKQYLQTCVVDPIAYIDP